MHLTRCACLFLFVLVGCSDEKGPLSGLAGSLSNDTFQTNPPDDDDNGDNDESDAETGPPVTSGDPATSDPSTTAPTTDGPTTDPPPTETNDPTTAGPTSEPGFCGDNNVDAGEDCDLEDLDGTTCEDLGFDGGTLFCQINCTFETSLCNASAGCGNGAIDGAEDCDCGGDACSASELGNNDCSDLGFDGGALSCDPGSCQFDTSGCSSTQCGNGTIDANEQCDGNNLGGFNCQSLGNTGGTLACDPVLCVFDASGCTNDGVCGDGTCDPNEDSCSCESDCPDDPNSCSPCQCGGSGGNCACDNACLQFNDCCANGPC